MYDYGDLTPNYEPKPQGGILKTVAKVSNWQTYVIYGLLAVIVVLGGIAIWQRGTVAKYKNDVLKAEQATKDMMVERDIAKANENSCRLNLDKQNTDISDAGKRYNQLEKEMAQLQKDIKDGKYNKAAPEIKKQPVPKTCQETLDFFNKNFP